MNKLKPPLSFDEQLSKLESRGLIVCDREEAIGILHNVNYYRLHAYSIELEKTKDIFFPRTCFSHIKSLYDFDADLRKTCMQATGIIEISLRTQFAYNASMLTKSPIPHENLKLFSGKFKGYSSYAEYKQDKIHGVILSSSEKFINHHRVNYSCFPIIPVWVMVEVITFSTLINLYSHIAVSIKNRIRKFYGAPSDMLLSNWFNICCVARNTCAHHSSLWNKSFPNVILPKIVNVNKRADFWIMFRMLYTLLLRISDVKSTEFKAEIFELVKNACSSVPHIDIPAKMGFPKNWETSQIEYW